MTPHDYCASLARAHYENFPVASRLVPARMRPHIAAVYAFARIADDLADEGDAPVIERAAALNDWRARLVAVAHGDPDPGGEHRPVFEALRITIARFRLPPQLFTDLVDAFLQDLRVHRYATWTDLLDYCRRSANPVGRLVLRIAGHEDPRLDAASDAVCTALQLTNFWQDLERDWKNGRLYVPADVIARTGASEADLDASRWTPAWRAALEDAGARTRALFAAGRPVADGVRGRLMWELRATWLGGVRVLDKLDARGYDVFAGRPVLNAADAASILFKTALWRRTMPDRLEPSAASPAAGLRQASGPRDR